MAKLKKKKGKIKSSQAKNSSNQNKSMRDTQKEKHVRGLLQKNTACKRR